MTEEESLKIENQQMKEKLEGQVKFSKRIIEILEGRIDEIENLLEEIDDREYQQIK